jgi:hypothetical protein
MSFPILWTCVFSWDPVARANPPTMDGPSGGVGRMSAWVENRSLPTAFGSAQHVAKTAKVS